MASKNRTRNILDVVQKALSAKRESKSIEFKQQFDISSGGEWCELIKDLVSIANSGGGIVIFGLDSVGNTTGTPLQSALVALDPADITNKVSKYTGSTEFTFEVTELERNGQKLIGILIHPAAIPRLFEKPGTYDIGSGKQKTTFSTGTVYFRHGAKSEPGTNEDLRLSVERRVEALRRSWMKGVHKVITAPTGSQVVTVQSSDPLLATPMSSTNIRAVKDPNATAVRLTRDRDKAVGSFVYEELSDGIFDEINNVIEANSLLAKGRQQFYLGQPVYYRIYAERQHITQAEANIAVLLNAAFSYYAPLIFWMLRLPDEVSARAIADAYLNPKSPQILAVIRCSVLLGGEFCAWLLHAWQEKWKRHLQPPQFYWTFQEMLSKVGSTAAPLLAAHLGANSLIEVPGEKSISVRDLLAEPALASSLLSRICMRVFEGHSDLRTTARNLDYIVHGKELLERGSNIGRLVVESVGDGEAGNLLEND